MHGHLSICQRNGAGCCLPGSAQAAFPPGGCRFHHVPMPARRSGPSWQQTLPGIRCLPARIALFRSFGHGRCAGLWASARRPGSGHSRQRWPCANSPQAGRCLHPGALYNLWSVPAAAFRAKSTACCMLRWFSSRCRCRGNSRRGAGEPTPAALSGSQAPGRTPARFAALALSFPAFAPGAFLSSSPTPALEPLFAGQIRYNSDVPFHRRFHRPPGFPTRQLPGSQHWGA